MVCNPKNGETDRSYQMACHILSPMLFTQPWQLLTLSQLNTFLFIIQDLVMTFSPFWSHSFHSSWIRNKFLPFMFFRQLYSYLCIALCFKFIFQFNKFWLNAPDVSRPESSCENTRGSKVGMVSGLTEHCSLCYIRWEGFLFIYLLSSVWRVLSMHIKLMNRHTKP